MLIERWWCAGCLSRLARPFSTECYGAVGRRKPVLISTLGLTSSRGYVVGGVSSKRGGVLDKFQVRSRGFHQQKRPDKQTVAVRKTSTLYYLAAVGVLVVGASYAAVPLYRIFCQSYSYGGTTGTHDAGKDLSQLKRIKDKQITIRFNADRAASLMWNFRPEQAEIIVTPGETALAFYRAENKTSEPVDGVSTYNVIPFEAGQYFNKIQCFCFEEQRLNPGETVELPVFFYIDPEFADDPKMESVDLITLSYTFFESKDMPAWNTALYSSHRANFPARSSAAAVAVAS